MNITVLYWIVLAAMIIGVIGAIIPGLPGSSIILAAILVWSIATGFNGVGWPLILIFIVLILSAGIEYLALYWGVQKAGASNWSTYGAIAGMTLGFFGLLPALPIGGPLFGILFGAIFGAFLGEYFYRNNLESQESIRHVFRVSWSIVVASIIGNIIEACLAALAVIIFVVSTWPPMGLI